MSKAPMTLYYGEGCRTCVTLEAYLAANSPDRLSAVTKKEIYGNRDNLEELRSLSRQYGIPEERIGVPFLAMGEKHLMGYSSIIAYLEDNLPD